jgi:SAM-dependent methyltransferase
MTLGETVADTLLQVAYDTKAKAYTERLVRLQHGWKQLVDVQAPYRWKLRRTLGDRVTLDVGCGIGRTLGALAPGSVGVDHNATSIQICRRRGLTAYTSDELPPPSELRFDGLLAAHLLEHLPAGAAPGLLREYLPYLRPGGRVMLICPQERGYASDETHLVFLDQPALRGICEEVGLRVLAQSSFPFPRAAGKVFLYNEFVTVAELPV